MAIKSIVPGHTHSMAKKKKIGNYWKYLLLLIKGRFDSTYLVEKRLFLDYLYLLHIAIYMARGAGGECYIHQRKLGFKTTFPDSALPPHKI